MSSNVETQYNACNLKLEIIFLEKVGKALEGLNITSLKWSEVF